MSEKTAKGLVVLSGVGMLAIVGLRAGKLSDPFRNAWAAGAIFVGLSLLADISPEVAGPLALLVLLAAYAKIGKTSGAGANIFGGSFKAPTPGQAGSNPVTQIAGG